MNSGLTSYPDCGNIGIGDPSQLCAGLCNINCVLWRTLHASWIATCIQQVGGADSYDQSISYRRCPYHIASYLHGKRYTHPGWPRLHSTHPSYTYTHPLHTVPTHHMHSTHPSHTQHPPLTLTTLITQTRNTQPSHAQTHSSHTEYQTRRDWVNRNNIILHGEVLSIELSLPGPTVCEYRQPHCPSA